MRFYLDHNIYIYSLNDESIGQAVETLKSDSVQFLYSPAHIEEVYTAFVKNGSKYQQNIQRIFEQISKFTDDMECLPSDTQIIIKREKPSDCYKRVAGIDTTQRMESDGKYKYQIDKGHYKNFANKINIFNPYLLSHMIKFGIIRKLSIVLRNLIEICLKLLTVTILTLTLLVLQC